MGRTFMAVHALVLRGVHLRSKHVTGTSGMSAPLVIVEHLCRGIFFLQEHQLRVKKATTFFWKIARGPLDCEDIENSKTSPLIPGKAMATTASLVGPRALMSASLTPGSAAGPVLVRLCFHGSSCVFTSSLLATRCTQPELALILRDVCATA